MLNLEAVFLGYICPLGFMLCLGVVNLYSTLMLWNVFGCDCVFFYVLVSKKSLKDRLGGYVRDKKSLKRHYMSNDQSSNSDLEDPVSQSHVKEDSPVQSKRGRRVTVDDDVTHDKVKLKLNIWSRIHKTESRSSRSSSSSRQEPPLRHSEVQEVGNSDPEYSALDDRSHKSSRVYSLAHSNKAHRVTVNDQRTPVSRKPKLEIWSRVDQEESKTSKSSSSLSHKPPSHSG